MSTKEPSVQQDQSSGPDQPLLDSHCDNPTRWEKRLSSPDEPVDDSADSADPENWNRQQKRVFHRVNTLLHYWESRDYQIVWVSLTSSPESDDADKLAYNLQRLRQTIERARLAYDADGNGHSLTHLDELEQLAIRTSEGPPGKGVLHLFWAWEPCSGQHDRDLYIPQQWLSEQWGRIHGPDSIALESSVPGWREPVEIDADGLWVWIEEYGAEDYHSRKNVARYCVTQYLGEHGEALEHVSWSHGRTLGGSLLEAWEAVRGHTESLDEAVTKWETVIAGESVALDSNSDSVNYSLLVEPPPNLGVAESEQPTISPPEDLRKFGPEVETMRQLTASIPEYDPAEGSACPECGEYGTIEPVSDHADDRVSYRCTATVKPDGRERCGAVFAVPGEGGPGIIETEIGDKWSVSVKAERQTALWEFFGNGPWVTPRSSSPEPEPETSGVSELVDKSRSRTHDVEADSDTGVDEQRIRRYIEANPSAEPMQVVARLTLPPSTVEAVATIMAEARRDS